VHDVVAVVARARAVEREGRVAHRVDVEVQRGHRAARGDRVGGVVGVPESRAVVRIVQRLAVRIHGVSEAGFRERHVTGASAGLRSDGRIDVLEATLGVGALLLEHVAVVLV
jgi:hypothetical protein